MIDLDQTPLDQRALVAAPADEWIAIVERAVSGVLAGQITKASAVAAIAAAVAMSHLDQTPAARMSQEAAAFLRKFDEYGGDRWAAGKVGAFFGRDPLDCERISQRTRKLARERKADRPARPRGRPQKKSELNSVVVRNVCDEAL